MYRTFGGLLIWMSLYGSGGLAVPHPDAVTKGGGAWAQADEAEVARMTVDELKAKLAKDEQTFIVDSRCPGSYDGSDKKIKGAIRLTVDEFADHLKEIPRDKDIVIYCA